MSTFIRRLFILGIVAFLSACVARDATPVQTPDSVERGKEAVVVHQSDVVSLEGWKGETFPLPPGFAPDLPTGTESLLFAPGWRNPKAEGFWSYAFVMWINEPAPNAARIHDLLEKYYNGLMSSFAAEKNKDIIPARVEVSRTAPNCYEARMHLTDAFATFEPIDLRVLIEVAPQTVAQPSSPKNSIVRIQISPQPEGHAIWRSLGTAAASIPSPDVKVHRR